MTSILLIEDDKWLSEVQEMVLAEAGFSVRVAHDGFKAIDMIDREQPDVIVADVLMAGATIFSLLHELQSYSDTNIIPVVLCTNIAEKLEDSVVGEYNIKRVVDKTTMEAADLVAAVKACL